MYKQFRIVAFIGLAAIAVFGGVFVSKSVTTKAGSQIETMKPTNSKLMSLHKKKSHLKMLART